MNLRNVSMHRRFALPWLLVSAAVLSLAQSGAKRPLSHRDYDSWRSIQGQVLSRDGKFLAYALFPQEGDGQFVVRNLATGKELKENAGTPPPPRESADPEGPPPDQTPGAGARVVFTHDNRFAIASFFPAKADTDKAVADRKRPEEMPKNGIVIMDLTAMSAMRVADVSSFQVPENGESLLAYLKQPKVAPPAAAAGTGNQDSDQARGGRGAAAGAARQRNQYGSDLVIRDLRNAGAKEVTLADVAEYSMSKDGKTLLYAVASRNEDANGIYSVVPGSDAAPIAIVRGKGHYTRITWDTAQREAAFLSDRDDAAGKPPKAKAYLWERSSPAAPVELVSVATPGFPSGYAIADRGQVRFSRDGSRLYLSTAPAADVAAVDAEPPTAAAPAGRGAASDKAVADLWNWKDDYVQPMQKVRSAQDRARTYLAVWNIKSKKFLQLADPTMQGLTTSDEGSYAIGTDDRTYRHMVDYDGNYNDTYAVDTATGTRKLILQKQRGGGGGGGGRGGAGGSPLAPDAKHLLAFRDKQWWSIQIPEGKAVNLTGNLGAAFFNEDHDTPDEPTGYGSSGWTKDGKSAILYDRYDAWVVAADGSGARKITDGKASNLQFRIVRLDVSTEEEPDLDPAKPLLLRAENLETRESGFYSLPSMDRGQPQRLLWGAKNYRTLAKAKDADVILMTATTFHDQPDLHVTDSTFRQVKKVTDANPQQAGLIWGTGELIKYRNADGVELQAALYKPENFDPSKKYPMIVYLYERLSQNVNNFVRPAPGHSINISYYVSNGYLVLTPDIVYTTGHPGQSALKCILPAVQTVVDKGFVNRNAIGIQGHSWGGYQTAYLVTQTNLFRAAEAGAPVVNMISAYDGIRWGTGLPRQFQYEKTQSRIGGSIWESPLQFIENSPIFMVNRITTPMLILHNDADDAVPWYQGIEFFLSLRRLGKEAYLFNYNGEPHHLNRRPNQKDYTVRMQQFFDHLLKDGVTPEWMQKGIAYNDREKEKERFITVYSEDPEGAKDVKK